MKRDGNMLQEIEADWERIKESCAQGQSLERREQPSFASLRLHFLSLGPSVCLLTKSEGIQCQSLKCTPVLPLCVWGGGMRCFLGQNCGEQEGLLLQECLLPAAVHRASSKHRSGHALHTPCDLLGVLMRLIFIPLMCSCRSGGTASSL